MTDDTFEPVLLCYAGERLNQGKRFVAFYETDTALETTTGEILLFVYKKDKAYSVGGIYGGAKRSGKTFVGLDRLKWTGILRNEEARLDMRARHEETMFELARAKLEKEAGADPFLAKLIDFRRLHTRLMKRYDLAGAQALEQAVLRALRTPIKSTEKE